MAAPQQILDLVERFRNHQQEYRLPSYKETQVRREFVDPFFKALGWDIANEKGHAEAYKDVIHEDAIKTPGGATKAPDYCFRIGGVRKFFIETKKPSRSLKDDRDAALQLRRYAWTAKLPLSILTDFEELAVYDCRVRPSERDRAATARIAHFEFSEYPARWQELASVFSPDAILNGSFDNFADSPRLKGTVAVDEAFLEEIESWRDALAHNIALRNRLTSEELNHAVQTTIDRIVFLRICEDRGIEPFGILRDVTKGKKAYQKLFEKFLHADKKYNSGLFHFQEEKGRPDPDRLSVKLRLDDKALQAVIEGLYPPKCPYEFSVMPAEILGHVYEQFLGKVIRLTQGGRAAVEYRPEVKKAGGVFYTPSYVVDLIVRQTVAPLVEGRHPRQVAEVRVLDPACGSGSFLIAAYQWLLDWHRDLYIREGVDKHKKVLYQGPRGDWRLTIAERKRILLNNIFGVDLDQQAVEVTKLSLLLKVLEGETDRSVTAQMELWQERALPDLSNNIKCGNSLVESDFYEHQQQDFFEKEQKLHLNPFDWKTEFRKIMASGGFDAVIGNPPYVRQETLAEIKNYLAGHYKTYHRGADLYVYFIEKGLSLLRPSGLFSIIVSSSILHAAYAAGLRKHMKESGAIVRLVDFGGLAVFENAKDTYVCIPLIVKAKAQPERVRVLKVKSIPLPMPDVKGDLVRAEYTIPASRLVDTGWGLDTEERRAVFERLRMQGVPLGKFLDGRIYYGLKTGLNEAFEIDEDTRREMVRQTPGCALLIKPSLGGKDIRRYHVRDTKRYLIVIPNGWTRAHVVLKREVAGALSERAAWDWFSRSYAPVAKHLEKHAEAGRKRDDQGEFWWELRPCDYYHVLDAPKIIYPDIAKGPRFFLEKTGTYIANTAYCLGSADPFLLAILNSRLAWFCVASISIPFGTRGGQFRYRLIYQYMEHIPIKAPSESEASRHKEISNLALELLSLHNNLLSATTAHDKEMLTRRINACDERADQLVYEHYGLQPKEIQIIEEATSPASSREGPQSGDDE